MKICPKCGAQNSDTQTFCTRCETSGKTCPSGKHTMDPSWPECMYCKQEAVAQRSSPIRAATVVEGQAAYRESPMRPVSYQQETPPSQRPVRAINSPVPVPTQPGSAQASRVRAPTEFRAIPNFAAETPAVSRDRKIVGLLVSYTWAPEGRIYPVREGRNFIGREKDCEICVPEDTTLSAHNTHITFRQNFVVGDMVSMTGTDVDGVPIEEQFRSLPNYATIRAGSTYFTFIVVKPPAAAAEP